MNCDSPFWVLPKAAVEKVPVPCGRCPNCKIRRVNSWVFRLSKHLEVSTSAHFVTLTYDTRFVPITDNGFMTLSKIDFQLYMKRLRKLTDNKLSYYVCGEYGSSNHRPHYHAIVFNCPNSEFFSDAWQRGSVHVGTVTSDSIAYCMKYIDKSEFRFKHSRDDRLPEFSLMSKRLGSNYLTPDVIAYHKADLSRLYLTKKDGFRIALPRYYRDKIYDDDERKAQIALIDSAISKSESDLLLQYNSLGYPDSFTFEDWKSSMRYGRYDSFYSQQNLRDL